MNPSPALPSFGVIPHLFPLRDGVLATLMLPVDLTSQEAKRLSAFIESLAVPDARHGLASVGDGNPNGYADVPISS